jgi:SAM-dependent methyltransferase
MKQTAMRFLVCPACLGDLTLEPREVEWEEVIHGRLLCAPCAKTYPIVRGVPRFVETDGYAESFGKEWTWFSTLQLDSRSGKGESASTLLACTGWQQSDYRGRLVLDAGVGTGRFAEVASTYGAEVVGVDLSAAVESAYSNLGARDGVHIIQADIFALPFRPATFDLAYSIGVLHHTPDTERAFSAVATTVTPGGGLAVYLYHRYGIGFRASDAIRRVSTKLPFRLTLGLSALAVPYYYLCRIPLLGKVLQLALPISMHEDWRWRWLDTFDWYSPAYQWKLLYPEVVRWFRANGFRDINVFDGPIRMSGVKSAAVPAQART